MKYFIHTYGCQMNYSDSERTASVLESLGFELSEGEDGADFLLFNTCSVRQKAEDRVLGLRPQLRELKAKNPHLRVALTGCMSRLSSTQNDEKKDKLLRQMPELDIIFQIKDLAKLPELIADVMPEVAEKIAANEMTSGSLENYFKIAPKKISKAQVFVPIMTGCDKFCTYCIVPFARGREFSRDFDEVVKECKKHVEEGAKEITLVGQTVNSYGLSFNDKKSGNFEKYGESPFAVLLREVDKLHEHGLKRLRFTSPHPRDFSDELIQTLAELKTGCPYIHMPVQSGDDEMLRRMNRNYRAAEYKEIFRRLRELMPDCAITTDIIVGFCGETDQEFENTYKMYEELQFDMCFLARYSPRKGTYSERKLKDDVTPKVKRARWHRLNDLLVKIMKEKHQAFVGQTVEVLVEKCENGKCSGRTPHNKEVFFQSSEPLVGELVQVNITKSGGIFLEGEKV